MLTKSKEKAVKSYTFPPNNQPSQRTTTDLQHGATKAAVQLKPRVVSVCVCCVTPFHPLEMDNTVLVFLMKRRIFSDSLYLIPSVSLRRTLFDLFTQKFSTKRYKCMLTSCKCRISLPRSNSASAGDLTADDTEDLSAAVQDAEICLLKSGDLT